MEEVDGIVKHPVIQDSMDISVQRLVNVIIDSVINKQGVSHQRKRHVSSAPIKNDRSNCFLICQRDKRFKYD